MVYRRKRKGHFLRWRSFVSITDLPDFFSSPHYGCMDGLLCDDDME